MGEKDTQCATSPLLGEYADAGAGSAHNPHCPDKTGINSHILVVDDVQQADLLRLRVEFARFSPYQRVSEMSGLPGWTIRGIYLK